MTVNVMISCDCHRDEPRDNGTVASVSGTAAGGHLGAARTFIIRLTTVTRTLSVTGTVTDSDTVTVTVADSDTSVSLTVTLSHHAYQSK